MRRISIGDEITYQLSGGDIRRSTVEGIEICPRGEKYGRNVQSCDIDRQNGVLDLADYHWCHFEQVKTVMPRKNHKRP